MYDYATVTKQNQIISLLDTLNVNITSLISFLQVSLCLIAFILVLVYIKSIFKVLLGGK